MKTELMILSYGFVTLFYFGLYKIINWIAKKIDLRSLWKAKDEQRVKNALIRLYLAPSLDALKCVFNEERKAIPKYNFFLKAAFREQAQQMYACSSQLSFEIREQKARKVWVIALAMTSFMWVFNFAYMWSMGKQISYDFIEFVLAIALTVIIFSTWIIYHNAYKLRETGWLSLSIWVTIIGLLFSPIALLAPSIFSSYSPIESGMLTKSLSMFSFANSLFYLVGCILLRRVNYELKIRNSLALLKEEFVGSEQSNPQKIEEDVKASA